MTPEPERGKVEKSVNFLRACAAWFRSEAAEATDDRAHWARVYNAENCDKAAGLLSVSEELEAKLRMTENIARMTGDERDNFIAELETTQQQLAKAESELASSQASLLRVVEALKWAMPLARIAMEDHRLERLRCGHNFGTKSVGLYDDEVDTIEKHEATLRTALSPHKET